MKFDGTINIATGMAATSKSWKNKKFKWAELVEKLSKVHRTTETYKEFIAATKPEQVKIKDVGGYVGGYLRNGRRKPANVANRQLLTLDIDFAHKYFWQDFSLQYECAAVLHGTHKHCETSPRLRLIIPLDREVSPDEYVAIARQVAGAIGIDLFDNTTFETNRLMFWPSVPSDSEYYFKAQDLPWLNADEILNSYADWKDSSLWPTADRQFAEVRELAKKQEDPELKKGIVGSFCRAYSLTGVLENFLTEEYLPTANADRFTYSKGTAAAGLVIYEDKFAFSHHGTDPCGGKLCNAFDLVRIHKFGHLDPTDTVKSGIPESFKAMERMVLDDKLVKRVIAEETFSNAAYDYADEPKTDEEPDIDWMEELEIDGKGKYLQTAKNINLILAQDVKLKGKFQQNEFDGKRYLTSSPPWRKVKEGGEPFKNVDYSGVRNYIETIYGIASNLKVDDSLALEFDRRSFHPIKDYLGDLVWDKVERVDTLLIDYFGADDNIYTREAIRKMLVGAIARVYSPGTKFDLVLTLVGEQGTYKSTFLNKLGKSWFSDTFFTVQGKEALEQIQGAWLIEMAELSGLRKADVEAVKHFISKCEDSFRPAYGRTSETYQRQCVFFATTNNKDFLKDPSGNRRFMPVDLDFGKATKSVSLDMDKEVDQIWAEAMVMYNECENLYLSKEAEAIARHEQIRHSETDERKGLIEEYLDKPLPVDWTDKDIFERRMFINDPLSPNGEVTRKYMCIAEIWCECLGKEKEDMNRYNTREINDIVRGLEGWKQSRSTKNFRHYGKQKYYERS